MRTFTVRIFFVHTFVMTMNLTSFNKSSKSRSPHFLLFGHPVEHSWSPLMHNTALRHYGMEARYHAIDLQSSELTSLAAYMNREAFLGANITIPYKQVIVEYLDDIDGRARDIGAVNTVVKQGYSLKGYNTDWAGFLAPLDEYAGKLEGGRAIIFGTGGASRAIVVGLKQMNVEEICLISRKPQQITSFEGFEGVEVISYSEWTSRAEEAVLIVNATPLGMYPRTNKSPVREMEKQFLDESICYDIVYNPLKTKFLKQASSVGSKTIGGLEMLIQQGSRSFEYWTGKSFPVEIVRNKMHEKLEE